ncbi:MAG TPA: hypothetical protein DCS74_00200 [Veillonellaceae bacterium]|jgi:predicted small metal-binding protein|nr:hypothetical protein [Veillonellaceae bacterium]
MVENDSEKREKRRQLFLNWNIEKELPEKIGEYRLGRTDVQDHGIYRAFAYTEKTCGWSVQAIFDEETMDYMVKTDLSLFTLTDIDMITGDFLSFQKSVDELLPGHIQKELIDRDKVSVLVRGHAFTMWNYQSVYPESICGFTRVIDPSAPVLGLNGSYVIAAYESREDKSGILFFYNMYRNEYYGEMRKNGVPIIIHQYDARSTEELENAVRKHMKEDLMQLGRKDS